MLVDGALWIPLIQYSKPDTLSYALRRAEATRLAGAKTVHASLHGTQGRCEFAFDNADQRRLRLLLHAISNVARH